jgi:hypothetical protein
MRTKRIGMARCCIENLAVMASYHSLWESTQDLDIFVAIYRV